MHSCKEGKLLGTCGPGRGRGGSSAAVAAATAAGTLVEEGQDGQLFLPILDVALEMGARVGVLASLRSRGFVRMQEAVGTCIGGGGGRAFGWSGAASLFQSLSYPRVPMTPVGRLSQLPTVQSGPGELVWVTTLVALSFRGQRDLPRLVCCQTFSGRRLGRSSVITKYCWREAMDIST